MCSKCFAVNLKKIHQTKQNKTKDGVTMTKPIKSSTFSKKKTFFISLCGPLANHNNCREKKINESKVVGTKCVFCSSFLSEFTWSTHTHTHSIVWPLLILLTYVQVNNTTYEFISCICFLLIMMKTLQSHRIFGHEQKVFRLRSHAGSISTGGIKLIRWKLISIKLASVKWSSSFNIRTERTNQPFKSYAHVWPTTCILWN